jgi:hypothetical protein
MCPDTEVAEKDFEQEVTEETEKLDCDNTLAASLRLLSGHASSIPVSDPSQVRRHSPAGLL